MGDWRDIMEDRDERIYREKCIDRDKKYMQCCRRAADLMDQGMRFGQAFSTAFSEFYEDLYVAGGPDDPYYCECPGEAGQKVANFTIKIYSQPVMGG
jgi:hypothetical protein